jgi:hypothetical protein
MVLRAVASQPSRGRDPFFGPLGMLNSLLLAQYHCA